MVAVLHLIVQILCIEPDQAVLLILLPVLTFVLCQAFFVHTFSQRIDAEGWQRDSTKPLAQEVLAD